MIRLTLPLALVLLGGGGLLGQQSDALRETPRPPPGAASLLGGLSSLAVHAAWLRADAAIARNDAAAALVQLDLIGRLEPQLVGGADLIADRIGGTLAGDEPDPARRYGLARAGLEVLDRAVEANPGLAPPLANRGWYHLLRIATNPDRARRFVDDEKRTPHAAALDDFRAAIALAPDELDALDGGAIAAYYEAIGVLRRGDEGGAAALADEAATLHAIGLALYRSRGVAPETKEYNERAARGLADVLSAPSAEREQRYREYYDEFGGPDGIPALPPPRGR